jgi:hypothetical protein
LRLLLKKAFSKVAAKNRTSRYAEIARSHSSITLSVPSEWSKTISFSRDSCADAPLSNITDLTEGKKTFIAFSR